MDECLAVLLERLKNEITRCVTINSINTIVTSPLKLDLSKALPDVLPLLADFLRKDQHTLRVIFVFFKKYFSLLL